tara:strand:+ start:186 stop:794 length:609 start_codon:yes stop_codon:yes gene_type:complete
MLLASNLTFNRSDKIIFEGINISASSGKIIFIKGNNGSGKTTLLKTLLNLLQPAEGEIYWKGKNINKNIFDLYNSTTFISDYNSSTPEMTVLENLFFWRKISSSTINDDSILNLLKFLNIDQYTQKKAMHLSQGELKKLELTRLILEQKKLWVLDEPFNNLDINSVGLINDTFIEHTENEGIIIFSSHFDPDLRNLETIQLS